MRPQYPKDPEVSQVSFCLSARVNPYCHANDESQNCRKSLAIHSRCGLKTLFKVDALVTPEILLLDRPDEYAVSLPMVATLINLENLATLFAQE